MKKISLALCFLLAPVALMAKTILPNVTQQAPTATQAIHALLMAGDERLDSLSHCASMRYAADEVTLRENVAGWLSILTDADSETRAKIEYKTKWQPASGNWQVDLLMRGIIGDGVGIGADDNTPFSSGYRFEIDAKYKLIPSTLICTGTS